MHAPLRSPSSCPASPVWLVSTATMSAHVRATSAEDAERHFKAISFCADVAKTREVSRRIPRRGRHRLCLRAPRFS